MAREFPAEPKPFALVKVPRETPKRAKAETHEVFRHLTGQLELTFTVESQYLFVGSGGYGFDPNAKGERPDVWHTFCRRNGQICVPGTSLKGAVRSVVEAISNSCVSQLRTTKGERINKSHKRCEFEKDGLCPACRLFGTTGLRGHVYFGDALPMGKVEIRLVKVAELWEPRRWANARRFYETKTFQELPDRRPQRNFRFVEAVAKEARFRIILYFETLNQAELGLLFHALGWQATESGYTKVFTPKLGGAKPRCFGAVRFEPKILRLWRGGDWQALLQPQLLAEEELICFLRDCLTACRQSHNLVHEPSWQAFVAAMQPRNEPCPKEVY